MPNFNDILNFLNDVAKFLNTPDFILGLVLGLIPLAMGMRARRWRPALFSLLFCGIAGFILSTLGSFIALFLMVSLIISYTYTNAQDPFLSRKSIEEVEFNETNLEFAIRQMAGVGRNLRWLGKALWRNKSGFIGFLGLVFFLLMITVGTRLVEYEGSTQYQRRPRSENTEAVTGAVVLGPRSSSSSASEEGTMFQAPSKEFPLGLDHKGRDILSHVVHGGKAPIVTSFQAGLFSTGIAVTLGALAALVGSYVDSILTGLANLVLTIPNFPLLLVLASVFRLEDKTIIALVLASLTWPSLMRSIRAQVLSLKEREYIEAAFSLDLGLFHIVTREVFPNLISYIAINFIFSIRLAMYALVGLILLGMLTPSEPDWGTMLWSAEGQGAFYNPIALTLGLSPVIAITLFQLSLILFSRSLEEVFNPRLRSDV